MKLNRTNLKSSKQFSKISLQKTRRPLMLGSLGEKLKNFPHVLRRKGAMVNDVVAVTTAKALNARSPDKQVKVPRFRFFILG